MGGVCLHVEELQRLLTSWKLSKNVAHLPSHSLEGSHLVHPSDFGHLIYMCTHRHRPPPHTLGSRRPGELMMS